MSKLTTALAIMALVICSHFIVNAQATTGTVRVTVVDANGNVVAGASVKVKNEGTGVESTAVTNADGTLSIAALNPGSYTITTEAKGFKRSVSTGNVVKVGITNPVSLSLETGNVSETVTVTAGTDDTLQTAQSQISSTIDTRRIQDLPSNGAGGGIDTLALLTPGVIANRVGGTNTNGTGLSVNGNRGRSNNFQIDGSDNNDLSVGGPALFVDFQDAVQEFQVVTNNFDARYGRNQGAVVNIVTKGGTNDFHGSTFLYHQDSAALDSLTNIQRRSGQLVPNRNLYNVFGGTIGGPVYLPKYDHGNLGAWSGKDRVFFFFAYQGIRNPSNFTSFSTSVGILPTDFARLQSTFPGNAAINAIVSSSPWAIPGAQLNSQRTGAVVPSATINPSTGQPFLTGGPYDVLNFGTAAAPILFQAAQYQRTLPTNFTEDYWSLRFDVKASDKDNMTFRYLKQKSVSTNGVGTISTGFTGDLPAGSTNWGGNWTHTFSNSILNDFRFNFQRIGVEFGGGCAAKTVGCIPGPTDIGVTFANIAFPIALGSTGFAMPTIGPATNLPQGRIGKVYQYIDNLTWVKGKHTLTFGFEYKYLNTIAPFLPNFNGAYSYSTAGLLAGQASATRIVNNAPSAVSITLGDPTLAFKEKDQYFYVQDDFKFRNNLTLNLGVRYEYTGQPINQLNTATVARESNAATALFNPSLPLALRTVPKTPVDKNNWAPRVGFAYTPHFWKRLFGEDATVFRGGFSIAYDATFYNILLNVQNAAPFSAALTVPASSLPPTSGGPAALPNNPFGDTVRSTAAANGILPKGVLNPIFLSQTNVASDFRSPYSEQFSFGMQRLIGKKNIVEVRWVGTHGIDLFQNVNGNFFIGPLVNGFTRSTRAIVVGGVTVDPATPVNFPNFASQLPPGTTAQVCLDNPATLDLESACNNRQFPFGGLTTRSNQAWSTYNALQARYNGRLLNDSLSLGASYTWSKTMDNESEIFAFGDINSPNAQNPYCMNQCETALSDLDRPHAFSFNFTYDVPFYKNQRGFVGHLLGGWQINSTYVLTSGAPFTPNNNLAGTLGLGGTYLTAGDRPFWGNPNVNGQLVGISQLDANLVFGTACVPAPCATNTGFWLMNGLNQPTRVFQSVTPSDVRYIINGPGAARIFGTPFGNVARNTERGPILNQLNMSLFKNINVRENFKVQLRGEAFNFLNHPNPGFGTGNGGFLPGINLTSAGTPGAAYDNFQDIGYARRVVQVAIRLVF